MTKQQNSRCAQRRLRSAWASAQSDQSSLSTWRNLGSLASHWETVKTDFRWAYMPFCWFSERNHLAICKQNFIFSNQRNNPRTPGTNKPEQQNQQNVLCAQQTQINLGICLVWSVRALRLKKVWILSYYKTYSKDCDQTPRWSDQTEQMPRLIWVFTGCKGHFAGFVVLWLQCSKMLGHGRPLGTCFLHDLISGTDKKDIWW